METEAHRCEAKGSLCLEHSSPAAAPVPSHAASLGPKVTEQSPSLSTCPCYFPSWHLSPPQGHTCPPPCFLSFFSNKSGGGLVPLLPIRRLRAGVWV